VGRNESCSDRRVMSIVVHCSKIPIEDALKISRGSDPPLKRGMVVWGMQRYLESSIGDLLTTRRKEKADDEEPTRGKSSRWTRIGLNMSLIEEAPQGE